MVIFIGGVSQGQKILSEGLVRLCGSCGSHGRYQVIMTYMYFSFFFIPLFKWNRRYYVKMDCCEAVYGNKSTASRQLFLRYEFLPRQAASSCVSACKSVFFVHASTMRSNCPDFLSKTEPPSSQSFA